MLTAQVEPVVRVECSSRRCWFEMVARGQTLFWLEAEEETNLQPELVVVMVNRSSLAKFFGAKVEPAREGQAQPLVELVVDFGAALG